MLKNVLSYYITRDIARSYIKEKEIELNAHYLCRFLKT